MFKYKEISGGYIQGLTLLKGIAQRVRVKNGEDGDIF